MYLFNTSCNDIILYDEFLERIEFFNKEDSDVILFLIKNKKVANIKKVDVIQIINRKEFKNKEFSNYIFGLVKKDKYIDTDIRSNIYQNKEINKIKIVNLHVGYSTKNIALYKVEKKKNIKANFRQKYTAYDEKGANQFLQRIIKDSYVKIVYKLNSSKKEDGFILISDGMTHGQDNGEAFARYLESIGNKNYGYVLDKSCTDYDRIKSEGINIIKKDSYNHLVRSLYNNFLLTSFYEASYYSYFDRKEEYRYKHLTNNKKIFLEHGITYNDHSKYGVTNNTYFVGIDHYLTGAKVEHEFLKSKETFDYQYLGLPRHDYLYSNSKKGKKILIFLTWRRFLLKKDPIEIENHIIEIQNLLSLRVFKILVQSGYEINLFLHHGYSDYLSDLKIPEYINNCTFDNAHLPDLIASSSLLINDYSSVQFEFYFQDKYVINYQFDKERFFSEHYFPLIDIDEMGLTNNTKSLSELDTEIKLAIKRNMEIPEEKIQKYDKFFDRRDNKNCERLYNFIIQSKIV